MTRDELRTYVFAALRSAPNTQWQNFLQYSMKDVVGGPFDEEGVREIIHELMTSNIIMFGSDPLNSNWPFFRLTTYGNDVINKAGPAVYDQGAYMAELKAAVPDLDPVVALYLSEALHAFHRSLFATSMVMLGCASERLIRLLISSFVAAIADEANRKKVEASLNKRELSEMFAQFETRFRSTQSQVADTHLVHDFELHVGTVFTFIRIVRNSIVHAAELPKATPAIAYSNLQQFLYYTQTIYGLIHWYGSHPVKL